MTGIHPALDAFVGVSAGYAVAVAVKSDQTLRADPDLQGHAGIKGERCFYQKFPLFLKNSKAALDKALQEAERENNPELEEIKNLFTYADFKEDYVSGTVAYHWKQEKWYPEFPEVAFVESFMQRLTLEKDENIEYFFLRVSEAYDNIEERGCFWDNQLGMGIVRKIVLVPEQRHLIAGYEHIVLKQC